MKHKMRGLALVMGVLAAFLLMSCGSKKEGEPEKKTDQDTKPIIAAKEATFNFGKVKQGKDVEHVFKITNKGNANLLIEKARGS